MSFNFPLSTLEQAVNFLDYHQPTSEQVKNYTVVNNAFQSCLEEVWDEIPEGPGKTLAIRALNDARMKVNSAIANGGI